MKSIGQVFPATALAFALAAAANAQPEPQPFDPATRDAVVRELAKALRDRYVFPDVGAQAAQKIEQQAAGGAYAGLGRPQLAEALTRDLREVAHDKHLGVMARPPRGAAAAPSREQREAEELRRMARDNFGVRKVEILPGNVGYLDLRFFPPAAAGGPTAIAAMNVLGNADAVIVDLRQNGGGDPTQIQLISSYFFSEPTHLNSLYWREGDRTEQFWTLPYVPGKRMADTPVFVLTSQGTFSGGEEFANNLKMLKRGTIVGETTGGGANPGQGIDLPGNMGAFIPNGRAINPISGKNWEGTGVEPDVKVKAEDALEGGLRRGTAEGRGEGHPTRGEGAGGVVSGPDASGSAAGRARRDRAPAVRGPLRGAPRDARERHALLPARGATEAATQAADEGHLRGRGRARIPRPLRLRRRRAGDEARGPVRRRAERRGRTHAVGAADRAGETGRRERLKTRTPR